jgi:hypothetical protein
MRPIASAYRKICIDIRCNSVEPVQSGVGEGKHRVVSRQTWSPGAERLKRYSADQIIGKHFSVFHPQTDVPAGKPAHELKVAAEVGHVAPAWRSDKWIRQQASASRQCR